MNHAPANPIGLEKMPPRFWAYDRDARGLVMRARSPGEWVLHVQRDERFRWQEVRDGISLLARTEYDEFGNQTEVHDAAGTVSRTRYDAVHRPAEITRGSSEVTRYKRNGIGQIIEQIGPGSQHETWQFDQYGHLVAHTNIFGHTVRREYDKEGMLTAITNGVGERLEYRRDAEGQIIEEKLFDGRVQRYEYDLMGRRSKIEHSDGRTVTQRFDPAGRLVCREASDGLVEEFAYDKEGRVIKAWNNEAVVEIERDHVGRILEETQNGRGVQYQYDLDGNRLSRSLPFEATGSKLKRVFDRRGRLVALEDEHGRCQELRWDNLDRLVERRCPGQVREFLTYDSGRRLHEQAVESPAGGFLRTHTYDASGNLAAQNEKRQGIFQQKDYNYDGQNRLTEVRKGGALVEAYEYDANDAVRATNRGRRSLGPGGKTLQDGSRELSYGPDGSIAAIRTGKATQSLKHDVNGRLVEAVTSDGTVVHYEYDPFGRRIAKVIGDDRTEFLWEGWTLAAELRGGELQSVYLCPELRPLAQWNHGERFTPFLDQRGAVQEMFDDSGRQRWACALDAYGYVVSQTGDAPNPFRLRGQYQDTETGLYYNYHRHYDSQLGDYTAADPIGVEGGFHFYAYPRNPLRWDDPFGLECAGKGPDGKDLPCEGPPRPPGLQTPPPGLADPPEGTPPNGGPSGVGAKGEIVRRFDTPGNVKDAKRNGIPFTPGEGEDEKGAGIPTCSTNIDPKDPDAIKKATGAENADAFMDIDITGKKVLRTTTKDGKKEIRVQEDINPDDIVGTGRTEKGKPKPGARQRAREDQRGRRGGGDDDE